jgi:hypothetical protein
MTSLLQRRPTDRRARRHARADEARLRAELASYRSEADRREIDEILDRHPGAEADRLRRLLP